MLSNIAHIKITGETGTLVNASAQFEPPNILIIAILDVPQSEWLELLDEEYPGVPVLWIIDPGGRSPRISRFFQNRPGGMLPLDSSEIQISIAIQALAQGLSIISPVFSPILAEIKDKVPLVQFVGPDSAQDRFVDPLTPREKEILQALGYGLANKEIALQFKLSDHTVKYHLTSIFSKLSAGNRTEAVRIGVKLGIITL
jgi:NarL family two-component system response regulator YdfI